jgi:hypothetical protein
MEEKKNQMPKTSETLRSTKVLHIILYSHILCSRPGEHQHSRAAAGVRSAAEYSTDPGENS